MSQPTANGLKAIITGATSGIGLHTLKRLYNSGAFECIIGLGRNVKNCQQVFSDSGRVVKNNTNVEFVECDLTKIQCVKEFAASIPSRIAKVDLLLNVAGIMDAPQQFTDYGVEIHFATNHLGHFLLAKLLLPHMAQDSRIINITSGYYTKFEHIPSYESVCQGESNFEMMPRLYYAQSKLANCLFTVALSNYIKNSQMSNVKVVAIRPGFIRGTNLGRYHAGILRLLAWPLIYVFSKNLDFGTDTIFDLSLMPIEEVESGRLYYNKKVENYTQLVNDENAQKLWDLSELLLKSSDKLPVGNTHSDSSIEKSSIGTT